MKDFFIKNNYLFSNTSFWEHTGAIIIALICLCSCSTVKYVPIQTEEKIIVKDSLVFINDTITVEVPFETIREVLPQIDTSILQTDLASSTAYLDTIERKLVHTLEQKGELKVKIDTCYITQTVEKIVYQDRPIEVEVVKYKRDALFWYLLIFQVVAILYIALRIYFKR